MMEGQGERKREIRKEKCAERGRGGGEGKDDDGEGRWKEERRWKEQG